MPNLSIENINSINNLINTISTHEKPSTSIVKDTSKLDTDRSCKSNLSYQTLNNTTMKTDKLSQNHQENKWDISSAKQPDHFNTIKNCWDLSNNQSFEIG